MVTTESNVNAASEETSVATGVKYFHAQVRATNLRRRKENFFDHDEDRDIDLPETRDIQNRRRRYRHGFIRTSSQRSLRSLKDVSHPLTGSDITFCTNVKKLVSFYKAKKRTCIRRKDDASLCKWCSAVRQAGTMGFLSQSRADYLNRVGFEWSQREVDEFHRYLANLEFFSADARENGFCLNRKNQSWFESQKEGIASGKIFGQMLDVLRPCKEFSTLICQSSTLANHRKSKKLCNSACLGQSLSASQRKGREWTDVVVPEVEIVENDTLQGELDVFQRVNSERDDNFLEIMQYLQHNPFDKTCEDFTDVDRYFV